ncbi:MAG: hypothetical protein PWP03_655 [Candidatus Woesearchaeota archaeon]|nr:hypothetical protein [Candidatus Woesearchaeota archaeon]MDN5328017.1 hypothetical protein [Candidatus Woesearchaeota archaeon]
MKYANKNLEKKFEVLFRSLLMCLFLIILVSKNVYSLGITPSEQFFEYVPGSVEKARITVINTLPYPIEVELSATDVLSNEVSFPEGTKISVGANQKASAPITVTLPEENTVYGKVCAIVWARRVPPKSSTISATEKVGAKFCTEIPYPGKYLELQVSPKSVNVGSPTTIVLIKYSSKGKEIINSIVSTVSILDKNGTLLKQYQTKEVKNLFTGAEETVALEVDTSDLLGGEYIVKVDTNYDGNLISKNATLTIGYPDIEIKDYSKNIAVNFADEFTISLKNKYLENFKYVYAEIIIQTPDGKELTYSTAPITLNANSYGTIKTVIPTQNLNIGEYPVKIILHFDGKTKEINGKVLVTEKTKPKSETQTPASQFNLSIIITLVVLSNGLILILLLVLINRNHKIKEDEL